MKKELKGFICGVIATSVLLCGGAFAAGKWTTIDVLQDDITVIVDGEKVTESNFVYNDRTYLPLRAVAEAVGKPVDYDESTNTAYIGSKEKKEDTETSSAPFSIQYDNEYVLKNNRGRVTQVESFEITNIEEENDGKLKITFEIAGQTNEDSFAFYLKCFDSDGYLVHSEAVIKAVSPYEQCKFVDRASIPANTVRIELTN